MYMYSYHSPLKQHLSFSLFVKLCELRSKPVQVDGGHQWTVPATNRCGCPGESSQLFWGFDHASYLGLPFGHFLGLWACFLLVSDFERKN